MLTKLLGVIAISAVLAITPAMSEQHEDTQGTKPDHSMNGEHAQTACPISGKPISRDVYVDHDGKRIYLCCPACKEKAEADAAGIIQRLESENIKLETVPKKQTLCPVMGGEIDKNLYSIYEGNKVYFCCAMCKPKFEAEPAKYIQQMKSQGVELEKAEKSE